MVVGRWLVTISCTSDTAEAAFAAVIRKISAMLAVLIGADARSILIGLAANKMTIRARSRPNST